MFYVSGEHRTDVYVSHYNWFMSSYYLFEICLFWIRIAILMVKLFVYFTKKHMDADMLSFQFLSPFYMLLIRVLPY